jgi:hypothetical protein
LLTVLWCHYRTGVERQDLMSIDPNAQDQNIVEGAPPPPPVRGAVVASPAATISARIPALMLTAASVGASFKAAARDDAGLRDDPENGEAGIKSILR